MVFGIILFVISIAFSVGLAMYIDYKKDNSIEDRIVNVGRKV
jgi:hypothetical protein